MPKASEQVQEVDREVVLNVKMRETLRHELRKRALDERLPMGEYLDRVLTKAFSQGAGRHRHL